LQEYRTILKIGISITRYELEQPGWKRSGVLQRSERSLTSPAVH